MPRCHDPSCACNKAVRGIYKTRAMEEWVREERGKTVDRLAKIEGLEIEHRDHSVWLTMDGCTAPCIVGHGSIAIRTQFPDLRPSFGAPTMPERVTIAVPRNIHKNSYLVTTLKAAIRKAHESYPAYKQAAELKEWFSSIMGRSGKVDGIVGGTAVVSVTLRLSLDEAEEFRRFLDRVRKDGPT